MINLAIAGASGRMGLAIVGLAASKDDTSITAALMHPASSTLGQDVGELAGCGATGVIISDQISPDLFDVMIDFSSPAAAATHIELCRASGKPILIGTTGLDEQEKQLAQSAAIDIPVVIAANTSVGINLCVALLETASKVIGEVTDIEIVEAHHRNKVDAPSGTALLLGEAVARPLNKTLSADGVFSRVGNTGPRQNGTIGFSTVRGGDIAGEHTVMFIGENERIEITHRASDRRIFARGALRAATWLAGQSPGYYDMRDVLGLR